MAFIPLLAVSALELNTVSNASGEVNNFPDASEVTIKLQKSQKELETKEKSKLLK